MSNKDLIEIVAATFNKYQEHVRVKRIMHAAFDIDKVSNSQVLQVDFAMAHS